MAPLDLSELPPRGAWGTITARNFPSALGETFERALLQSAQKRRVDEAPVLRVGSCFRRCSSSLRAFNFATIRFLTVIRQTVKNLCLLEFSPVETQ